MEFRDILEKYRRELPNESDKGLRFERLMHGCLLTYGRYALQPHRAEVVDAAHEYFKARSRGKLITACGTGKTFAALRIAEDLPELEL
ncbi:MAG: hypothetical protein FWH47_04020 [Methanomassiliicoccaceae archaeon]|nr:hypothetical protein [Methanomassiliicoccaceae archaeon]